MIGSFGKIIFETSSKKILTFDEFERTSAAKFAAHEIINQKPKLQATGEDLDTVSFSVRLSASLGVTPKNEIKSFRRALIKCEPQKLIMGGKILGDFVLERLTEKWKQVDSKGRLIVATLDVQFKEYIT